MSESNPPSIRDDIELIVEKTNIPFAKQIYEGLKVKIEKAADSNSGQVALAFGRLIKKAKSGQFLEEFLSEFFNKGEAGEIKTDYLNTDQGYSCFQEIIDFIENDTPDNKRFSAVKALFFSFATDESVNRDDILGHSLMKILRELNSVELVVLFTAYRIFKEKSDKNKINDANGWLIAVTEASGLKHRGLIDNAEPNLEKLHLIAPRKMTDRSGIAVTGMFRLTSLAVELCEYIEKYDPNIIASNKNPETSKA